MRGVTALFFALASQFVAAQAISDSLTRMQFYNRIESFNEAVAVMARTRALIDEDTAFFFHLTSAVTATGLNQFDSAEARYTKAYMIDSTRSDVKRALAIAKAQNNDLPAAISAFKRILSEDDLATKERMWLAKLYVKQDMLDSALHVMQARPTLLQNHFNMQHMEARLLYRMNHYGPSKALYKKLIKRKPGDSALFLEYVKTLAKASKLEVIDQADWIFERLPTHQIASIIAKAHMSYNQLDQALRWFNTAIDVAIPDQIDSYYSFAGYVAELLERDEDAIAHYEKAVSYNPDDGFHAYHLGVIYDRRGMHDRAKAYFQTFLRSPQSTTNPVYTNFANERLMLYKQADFMQRGKE